MSDLLTEADIVDRSIELGVPRCGVYFLIQAGKVMYVGQSVNIDARIGQHRQ